MTKESKTGQDALVYSYDANNNRSKTTQGNTTTAYRYYAEEFGKSYTYRYDLQKKKFETLHEENGVMYLACSAIAIVYLQDSMVYVENVDGSHKRSLGKINTTDANIYIQGKHILVDEKDERIKAYRWSE